MSALPIHEEHGEVVSTWRELGYREETVVCFDRHLDLKPLSSAAEQAVAAASDDAALGALNRQLPMREAAGAYGLDDFFAVGAKLGAVKRLLWVLPTPHADEATWLSRCLDRVALIAAEPDTLERTDTASGVLRTRLCGLDLEIHTVTTLARMGMPEGARIDVDLDWLADVDSGQEHTPADLLAVLERFQCVDRLDSLTWSIRSGFLPEHLRDAARAVADAAGRTLRPVPRPDSLPLPESTFALLRATARPERDTVARLVERELLPLGDLGTALAGLLAIRSGDVDAASEAWVRARDAGLSSTWLAYALGMYWYGEHKNHARALEWFSRARGERVDTLEAHAAILETLCLLRLGRADEALRQCWMLAGAYPFRRDVFQMGRHAALSLGARNDHDFFVEHQGALARLLGGTPAR